MSFNLGKQVTTCKRLSANNFSCSTRSGGHESHIVLMTSRVGFKSAPCRQQ